MRHAVWVLGLIACGVEAEVKPEECERGCEEQAAPQTARPAPAVQPAPPGGAQPSALVGQALETGEFTGVKQWYTQRRAEGELEVVVFFEVWCPHCRNEMPHLTALDAMPGVEVVALTRQSRGVTDEQVRSFVDQHHLPFGVAQVDEQLAQQLGIRGIPRAVVVKDGTIVWDGHPGKLAEEDLQRWL
jgi:thiol-disulfide isomerase/thioredoxin